MPDTLTEHAVENSSSQIFELELGSSRMSMRNLVDFCLSLHQTIVWFSCTPILQTSLNVVEYVLLADNLYAILISRHITQCSLDVDSRKLPRMFTTKV
jgi:hypothetical protein